MQVKDDVGLRGEVLIEVVNAKTGAVEEIHQYNALTSAFKQAVASLIANGSISRPTHIALGTGSGSTAEYDASNQDTNKVLKSTGADQRLGQKFNLGAVSTTSVQYFALWMKRIGSSLGSIYLEVWTNSAGAPGALLGTSVSVNADGLGTSYDWAVFQFAPALSLSASTDYWLVLRSSTYTYSAAATEIILGTDASSPPSNQMVSYDGSTWSAVANTACFRTAVVHGASDTALAGETLRKALTSGSAVGTQARLLANFTTSENNDFIGEVGLFNAASGPSMHAVITTAFRKTNQQAVNVYWLINVL